MLRYLSYDLVLRLCVMAVYNEHVGLFPLRRKLQDQYTCGDHQGDNDGEATGIAPVIHTIDRDGTERWFDLSGRQLSGKPTKKGVYIHRGKKQVVK